MAFQKLFLKDSLGEKYKINTLYGCHCCFSLIPAPIHNLCAALPNFRSSEDYDHHVIANHLQIKHDQHNPTINQGSSKCCLSEIKGKTHVGFNEASL